MKILFTGYAHVHFACFLSLFERLVGAREVEAFVSGGLREKRDDGGYDYDLKAMYGPFGLTDSCMRTVDEIADEDYDIVFAGNTNLILPRRVGRRIQIFHGVSFRNRAVRPENTSCENYFIAGPYMRRAFVSAGLFAENDPRLLPIGFMKTDRLLNGELDRTELLRSHELDGGRPIVLYAPTGQRDNSLETVGEDVIRRLNETDQYDLLIKLHDHPKRREVNWRERLQPHLGDHCRLVDDLDVIPLLYLADLLISDASSVTNEYALLDRPMVFLDVPKLLKRARKLEGSMLDLESWGRRAGPIVRKGDDVALVVEDALANAGEYATVRQGMARDLFYNPGRSTEAAADWLAQTVGLGDCISQVATRT